jgi:hypothetical protein
MDSEGWGRGVKELVSVIVREDDPQIGFKRSKALADVGSNFTHMRDDRSVFGIRHGKELGRVRQYRAADHCRHHDHSPSKTR